VVDDENEEEDKEDVPIMTANPEGGGIMIPSKGSSSAPPQPSSSSIPKSLSLLPTLLVP
jgi:hypothetical protein